MEIFYVRSSSLAGLPLGGGRPAGATDRECRLCFAVALWNGRDPILKERLFGLANHQGNHGEDVKEVYFYIASTPTHSYVKGLYKYPQAEFPYARLIEENAKRSREEPEFELEDTGIFLEDRYFDVFVEYAKAAPDDVLIRLTVANRGPAPASLDLLPTLWFRNTWVWGRSDEPKPRMGCCDGQFVAEHPTLGRFRFAFDPDSAAEPELLFTENETNFIRLFGVGNAQPYVKDAFDDYVVHGRIEAVNPARTGTKAAARYHLELAPGQERVFRFRLFQEGLAPGVDGSFDAFFATRIKEADEFYSQAVPASFSPEEKVIALQAWGGLFWSKQFYNYVVKEWLEGDPTQPPPPASRLKGRNHEWTYLYNRDVLSMPDKWEYPWYASWDLAFHAVALAKVDPELAKDQLVRFLREWYMHPSGQLPAYEFEFSRCESPGACLGLVAGL